MLWIFGGSPHVITGPVVFFIAWSCDTIDQDTFLLESDMSADARAGRWKRIASRATCVQTDTRGEVLLRISRLLYDVWNSGKQ